MGTPESTTVFPPYVPGPPETMLDVDDVDTAPCTIPTNYISGNSSAGGSSVISAVAHPNKATGTMKKQAIIFEDSRCMIQVGSMGPNV